MTEKPYFVILQHQKPGKYLPLVDENDFILMFESESMAIAAGQDNILGDAFGFEVFEIGG